MIVISSYSGRCDFGDSIEIHGVDNLLKSKIYIGNNIVPLKMESYHDLIPYAPYLVSMSASEHGVGTFILTNESYVDMEERERLEWYQKDAIKYVNKCKRKKEKIDLKWYEKQKYACYPAIETAILSRVANKDFSLDGLHLPIHEMYRRNLYEEMLRVGWSELKARRWCFGWQSILNNSDGNDAVNSNKVEETV